MKVFPVQGRPAQFTEGKLYPIYLSVFISIYPIHPSIFLTFLSIYLPIYEGVTCPTAKGPACPVHGGRPLDPPTVLGPPGGHPLYHHHEEACRTYPGKVVD